ncbi:hypothetical protein PAMC26510_28475 [Caballeronia sordidicola]|uniref:Uncharacterized protein n=1 Tax=Caballeronia sordidicola TaxID=196367 RepID=A0A242MC41_CABSO|nr:hypothetical protein PAMC26510_28475 [Caballeronia sordidicola]
MKAAMNQEPEQQKRCILRSIRWNRANFRHIAGPQTRGSPFPE